MNNYRWNSVEITSDRTIPLIIDCPQDKLEGVVLGDVRALKSGRVLEMGDGALELFVSNGPKFRTEYGPVSDDESSRLLGLLQLIDALKHRDKVALEAAIQRLAISPIPEIRQLAKRALLENPGWQLGNYLAGGLRDVQLVMWCKDNGKDTEILPGLYCRNATSALYALVSMRLSGGQGLGACLNCGKPLIRKRGTRKFCSDACRYAMFEQHRPKKRHKREKAR